MPAVFVHGVPETPAIWDPLLAELRRDDVVTLQLPGFGCPRPDGFGATKDEYVTWLMGELERLGGADGGPIDLVGHDWGGAFVVRVVSTRPELVRSWVTDAASVFNESFEWHEFAKLWQTPGAGEEFFDQQLTALETDRSGPFASLDRVMADSILDLYRSAVDVGKEWGPEFRDIPRPGLVLVPGDDVFLSADLARATAVRAGAAVAELDGVGHWWMQEVPARGAAVLDEFWASLDA